MSEEQLNKEQRILRVMRKTLGRIVREVTPPPGMRHPLSDATIADIRQCLGLIAARERELAEALGQSSGAKPYYADEAPAGGNVISIDELLKKR